MNIDQDEQMKIFIRMNYPSTSAARSLSEYSGGKFFMYKFVSLNVVWFAFDGGEDGDKPLPG